LGSKGGKKEKRTDGSEHRLTSEVVGRGGGGGKLVGFFVLPYGENLNLPRCPMTAWKKEGEEEKGNIHPSAIVDPLPNLGTGRLVPYLVIEVPVSLGGKGRKKKRKKAGKKGSGGYGTVH